MRAIENLLSMNHRNRQMQQYISTQQARLTLQLVYSSSKLETSTMGPRLISGRYGGRSSRFSILSQRTFLNHGCYTK